MKKLSLIGSFVIIALVCCIGAAIHCCASKFHGEPKVTEGIGEV